MPVTWKLANKNFLPPTSKGHVQDCMASLPTCTRMMLLENNAIDMCSQPTPHSIQ